MQIGLKKGFSIMHLIEKQRKTQITIDCVKGRFRMNVFSNTYSPIGKCNNVILLKEIFEIKIKFVFKVPLLNMYM
jgi:hypothetical protein